MDKKKQQALFEVQLFLPYEIKTDKLKRDVTVSLPASEEQLEQVVTHVVPLKDSEKVFDMIADESCGTIKVIVDCQDK